MPQPDDGRGNLYEQVLEYAKREMDEAATKMEDIKQSLQLLEARVEAAKAVYQAVASRLNLEDEADGAAFETSFPELPAQAPEPPPASLQNPVDAVSVEPEPTPPPEESAPSINGSPEPAAPTPEPVADTSDLDVIRQHLAAKAEREESVVAPPPQTAAAPAAPAAGPSDDDSFSMQLIRQHLEQKAQQQEAALPAEQPALEAEPAAEPAAEAASAEGGTRLSAADRELIGAYLRSKQN